MKKKFCKEQLARPDFLWDTVPAHDWADCYPIGNGRLGAMVKGHPQDEVISLNHDRLWRSYLKNIHYETAADIPQIRALCAEKKWKEADRLLRETVPYTGNAIYINPFVPAADLYLKMHLPSDEVDGYFRALELAHGMAVTEFENNGVRYTRNVFCSCQRGVVVVHLSASTPGMLTGEFSLSRMCDPECEVTGYASRDYVAIDGLFEEGKHFGAVARVWHRNGRITSGKKTYGTEHDPMPEKHFGLGYVFDRNEYLDFERGASLCFDSCDEVTLLICVATDDESENPTGYCLDKTAELSTYDAMEEAQRKAFSSVYYRMKLNLHADLREDLTTAMRLEEAKKEGKLTPFLTELTFNMARYVAISSGMPQAEGEVCKAPIHLQGLWNRDTRPAWESDYHTDLNIEMCYWPLANAGLLEWYEPFLAWVERLVPQAEKRAKELYGAQGIALCGCCDPDTLGVCDNVGFGWLTSTAWLMQILWIYYEHQPQKELLMRMYPLMLRSAAFLESMFVKESDGRLTFPFGSSPEMGLTIDGELQWLSSVSTIDLMLTRDLFLHIIKASEILGDGENAAKYRALVASLRDIPVDKTGSVTEWVEEHVEAEPGHRHRSPWVSFCPGTSVNLTDTPEMVRGLTLLLERRLGSGSDKSTSFSFAWDSQLLARLGQGDRAFDMLRRIMPFYLGNMMIATNDYEGKGYGMPWFPGHKVMQVDAQLCLISSIVELIYQDCEGVIAPLAALPKDLPTGSISGIVGRGGFVTDLAWQDGSLQSMRILSRFGQMCRVRLPEGVRLVSDEIPPMQWEDERTLSFATRAGEAYILVYEKM